MPALKAGQRHVHVPPRKGRWFDACLRADGWSSEFRSVQSLLDHLSRKTKSEASRARYLETLAALCRKEGRTPDQLVQLSRSAAEDAVQSFVDGLAKGGRSIRYVDVCLAQLVTFFRANGFKRARELDVSRYHLPARYRKVPEYIPTAAEIEKMVVAGRDPMEKAVVLVIYEGGLRNATGRALRYGEVKEELDAGMDVVHVPVRSSMKEVDPNAAKGGVEYDPFMGREAVAQVLEYLDWFPKRFGTGLQPQWPLFPARTLTGRPMKVRTLQAIVKRLARRAGVKRWADVHPHCLRKAFENAVRNSGLDWKDQELLMGHVLPGSMDTYVDKTRTEEFREKYRKVRFFPDGGLTREETVDIMRKGFLKLSGYSEEETTELGDLSELSDGEMSRLIDEKWGERRGLKKGLAQKVVPKGEVRSHIEGGWEFVTWLDEAREEAVVRLPG